MKKYITLKNFGWLLTALVTFMLGMSGVSKIVGTEEMVKNFTSMNLLPYLALLGAVELSGVVMLCIPKTSKYGAVLLSSYLSGAVSSGVPSSNVVVGPNKPRGAGVVGGSTTTPTNLNHWGALDFVTTLIK